MAIKHHLDETLNMHLDQVVRWNEETQHQDHAPPHVAVEHHRRPGHGDHVDGSGHSDTHVDTVPTHTDIPKTHTDTSRHADISIVPHLDESKSL